MLTKSASEIIRQAKFLAQCENSDFLDDFTTLNILNEVYEEIYQDIITHTKNYICEVEFDGEMQLPCDCYQIASVEDFWGNAVEKCPEHQYIAGCYTIEGQCLKIIGSSENGSYKLKYFPAPVTITAGGKPIYFRPEQQPGLADELKKVVAITDEYVIYQNGERYGKYTFETKTSEEVYPSHWDMDPIIWNNQTIVTANDPMSNVITSIMINNEEKVNDYNKIPNPWYKPEFGEEDMYKYKQPMFLMTDGEDTLYITYLSIIGDVPGVGGAYETYAFDTEGNSEIIASSLRKEPVYIGFNKLESGMGIVAYDAEKHSYVFMSWLPDTLLDFPVNIFYTVMEERIALLLASIVGNTNDYLFGDYKDRIEQQYYDTLKHDDYSPGRIRNVTPARR